MIKFGIYVDGSALIGALNKHELKVDDFEGFYRYAFEQAVKAWSASFLERTPPAGCQLHRVHWYQVAGIDRIDFSDPKTQGYYRNLFESDEPSRRLYAAFAAEQLKSNNTQEIAAEAFRIFFEEKREWYTAKSAVLDAMRSFNHAIQAGCDFIEIIPCGHWKINLIGGHLTEKGIDTSLAVDLAGCADKIDVAVILANEYDAIAPVRFVKDRGKNVGVIDIRRGDASDAKPRQGSSRLHNLCDFVCPIYEADLVARRVAQSRGRHATANGAAHATSRHR